jgi:exodeoxyribonuclease-5
MEIDDRVFQDTEALLEGPLLAAKTMSQPEEQAIQGGRQRGIIMHKLIEEVLTGETAEEGGALDERASQLMAQLGLADEPDPENGPSNSEITGTVRRVFALKEIEALRPRLLPEFPVYAKIIIDNDFSLTAGIADAVAIDDMGHVDTVIDWKSDVDPTPKQIELYRDQVRGYLDATGAKTGLIVFLTTGRVEYLTAEGTR